MNARVWAAVLAVAVLAACSDNADEDADDPAGEGAADLRQLAVDDLASVSGADPDLVDVVVHEQVTWRDAALGCLDHDPPQAGDGEPVEGYWIVLRLDGQHTGYHGAAGQPPVRCDQPDPDGALHDIDIPPPVPTP